MELYIPTKMISGKDCVREHGKELSSLGEKALIVTGRHSSKKNGSLSQVKTVLKENGTDYLIFDDIEENPSIETIMKIRETYLCENVDFIIGIGGGSPMDAAKAIALMMANPDKGEEILYQKKELLYLPVAEIPTTAGTGSEVTPYAILTIHAKRTKQSISHRIYPKLALVDAGYLRFLGREYLISTAVDALAHLVESYLNTNANEYNRIYSEKGLHVFGEIKEQLEIGNLREEDFEGLMFASTLAGMAITHTGTSLPHALSYKVTYELGMSHGKAVGIHLGGYVECYKDRNETDKVLKFLGFHSTAEMKAYLSRILGEVKLTDHLRAENAREVIANKGKLKNYPFPVSEEELYNMNI